MILSLQVHRFNEEVFIILGNHGAHLSVWKASLKDSEGRNPIEVSVLV